MVAVDVARNSNALLKDANIPKVSVFVGGTAGIGQEVIDLLVKSAASPRIYLIGRPSAAEATQARIEENKKLNPNAEIIWVSGQVSLQADVKRICDEIRSKESSLDLLFLSTGDLPFNGRTETSEGFDVSMSIQYYARITFIRNLLPLLRASPNPRVVSVKAGGMERLGVNVDDLGLKQPGSFGLLSVQVHIISMNTMMLEKLAEQEKNITFIHANPGQVFTGNNMGGNMQPSTIMGYFVRFVFRPLASVLGMKPEESAQRHLFQSTSAHFGGKGVPSELPPAKNTKGEEGQGLFLVSQYSDFITNEKTLNELREKTQDKIWEHTLEELKPYIPE